MRTMNEAIRKLRLGAAISPKEIRAVHDFTKPHPAPSPSRLVNSLREETNEGRMGNKVKVALSREVKKDWPITVDGRSAIYCIIRSRGKFLSRRIISRRMEQYAMEHYSSKLKKKSHLLPK